MQEEAGFNTTDSLAGLGGPLQISGLDSSQDMPSFMDHSNRSSHGAPRDLSDQASDAILSEGSSVSSEMPMSGDVVAASTPNRKTKYLHQFLNDDENVGPHYRGLEGMC